MRNERKAGKQDKVGFGESTEARRLHGYKRLLTAILDDDGGRERNERVLVLDLPEQLNAETLRR